MQKRGFGVLLSVMLGTMLLAGCQDLNILGDNSPKFGEESALPPRTELSRPETVTAAPNKTEAASGVWQVEVMSKKTGMEFGELRLAKGAGVILNLKVRLTNNSEDGKPVIPRDFILANKDSFTTANTVDVMFTPSGSVPAKGTRVFDVLFTLPPNIEVNDTKFVFENQAAGDVHVEVPLKSVK